MAPAVVLVTKKAKARLLKWMLRLKARVCPTRLTSWTTFCRLLLLSPLKVMYRVLKDLLSATPYIFPLDVVELYYSGIEEID